MNQMLHLDSTETGYTGIYWDRGFLWGVYRNDSPASFMSGTYSYHGARPMVTQSGNLDVYSDNISADSVYELRNETHLAITSKGSIQRVPISVSQHPVIH